MRSSTMNIKQWVNHAIQSSVYQPARPRAERGLWIVIVGLLIASDLFFMILAFNLADSYRTLFSDFPFDLFHEALALFLIPLWIIIFAIFGLYQRRILMSGNDEFIRIFRAITIAILGIIVAGFMVRNDTINRGWLFVIWGLVFFFVSLGRLIIRLLIQLLRRRGHFLTAALIVGVSPESYYLAEQFAQSSKAGIRVVGFVDDNLRVGATWGKFRVLGSLSRLDAIIRQHNVEEVIISTGSLSQEQLLSLFKRYGVAEGIKLRLSSGLFEIITTGVEVTEVASVPLAHINKVRLTGSARLKKMFIDYAIAIPLLIFGAPILLALAIAIRLDSPGPIIYRRRVVGANGKEFDAFKFRTMYMNGNEILAQHPELRAELAKNHKLKEDPRITRIGHILRKYSLDELPQLFNVLRQEMSLIGPRMIAPHELAEYNQWDVNLLTMRPGITGLWQVSGRSDLSYEERVRLDMYYIRNWSFWLDLSLIWRTIPILIFGSGAY